MFFLPRPLRLLLFFLVTPFQIAIILTANLGFLNYLVLVLGVLLLDDRFLSRLFPRLAFRIPRAETRSWKLESGNSEMEFGHLRAEPPLECGGLTPPSQIELKGSDRAAQTFTSQKVPETPAPRSAARAARDSEGRGCGLSGGRTTEFDGLEVCATPASGLLARLSPVTRHLSLLLSGLFLSWIFYNTTVLLLLYLFRSLPVPLAPVAALESFRISNQYGLFAVMTTARYEIEFQGTRDGQNWLAYPFRYKPQDPRRPPKIHAPYQPRFDWNLWFASLGSWRQYPWVVRTEALLLKSDPSVLALFAGNPFPGEPPRIVRAVVWQYWFTDLTTKRKEGLWWHRELRGLYAPTLERDAQGNIGVLSEPVQ
jgi:hypothetical protein